MGKALTIAAPGTQMFGVPGLTTGAVAIVTVLIGNIIIRWVQGMAARRHADNEGITVVSGVNDAVYKRLNAENERLSKLVEKLSTKIDAYDERLAAADRRISELERELHDVRKGELGSISNAAQTALSSIEILKGKDA